jgi:twitching motility protein PilT
MNTHPELQKLIDRMIEQKASDLVLTQGQSPLLRIVGELQTLGGDTLSSNAIRAMAYSLLSDDQIKEFESTQECDSSFGMDGIARFRVNVFVQRGHVGVVIRMLPHQIPTLEDLGVPLVVKQWLDAPHGIIITTGPTGSGKSTSQAAMIGHLNHTKRHHVITIEDPVEYVHDHGTCVIEQREVGKDTASFSTALKRVFRQTPNVIMIGEMRDRETFESALQLAETGHLVLATLHTGDSMQAINRIVDMFPAEQQQQIKLQLSLTLIGILVQQLVPSVDGKNRYLACEVLKATPAVRNQIRKNDIEQIYSAIETGSQLGMITMNDSLLQLFEAGKISKEEALLHTVRHKEFETLLNRKLKMVEMNNGNKSNEKIHTRLAR